MKSYFLAEKLKYRHTFLNGLLILMPLISTALAACLTYNYFAVDSYNWWYMGLYPGLLGIICTSIGGKEKKKKNYTVWSLPCRMEKIWDAKVLTGSVMSGIAMLCCIILTIAIGKGMENVLHITFALRPSVKIQLAAGMVIWLTTLWQVPFCLFLSQKMGAFLTVLVHMGSYAVISATVSLKPWFALLPGAITSRMMCPILGILPNGLPAMEGQMTYLPEFMEAKNLFIGILAAVVWFLLFWIGSRKWYQRQVAI